jgi:MoaA/NifB/PqqE/SkfB family radical SAM enzyme
MMSENNYCRRPFTEMVLEPDGTLAPCCVIQVAKTNTEGFIETNIEQYLASRELSNFQNEFLLNRRPMACQVCWKKERAGMPSLRISRQAEVLNKDWKFTEIHLKLNSICNFKCRMCGPYCSSSWLREEKEHGVKMDKEEANEIQRALLRKKTRDDLFERVIPNTRLIRISGGEPLLSVDSLEFFDEMLRRKLNEKHFLVFTNLSKLKFANVYYPDYWKQFPKLRLIASCDGAGESVEYSRTGLIWANFIKNLTDVRHRVRNVNCVINIYSVYTIPELVGHCYDLNIDINIEPVFRDEMGIQMLPLHEKLKIKEHYERFISSPSGQRLNKEYTAKFVHPVIKHMFDTDLSETAFPYAFKARNEELDRRRGTDFAKTFPQLKEWYESLGHGDICKSPEMNP